MIQFSNPPDDEFQRIRDDLRVPSDFPALAIAEADEAIRRDPQSQANYTDLLAVPFITIDPPGSRDLDQAFFMMRVDEGYQVRYAIADVGFFVTQGGELEREAWRRGQTLYSPDLKTPLYPPMLSEGGASLLPEVVRPAVVFTFTLNAKAEVIALVISRALVSSRAQLNYPQVSEHLADERKQAGSGALAGQEWAGSLRLLEEIGIKRQRLEVERGGISLRIPSQQVQRWSTAAAGYRLAFEAASEVEDWNAQISLMTGMGAARTMLAHNVGLLRIVDPPRHDRVRALRLTAHALGVNWPAEMDYDDFVRGLHPHNATHAVILHQAARVTGGARYVAFADEQPHQVLHAAIAAPYAHVTAPLRRLADRYALELLVALAKNAEPATELITSLAELPRIMAASDNVSRRLESAIVDCVEARLMQERIGEVFTAIVIALRLDGAVVQITEPPIRTLIPTAVFSPASQMGDSGQSAFSEDGVTLEIGATKISLGQSLLLKLEAANPRERSLRFVLQSSHSPPDRRRL